MGSVLLCWALGFASMVVYSLLLSWTEERAQADGVFLVHALLDDEPAPNRPQRLDALQQHARVEFELITHDEVERRVGRRAEPDEWIHHEVNMNEEWYFAGFTDGQGALAAGPVDPTVAVGFIPFGIIMAFILLPVVAGLIALRVELQLTKVERASQALATGQLSARVDNPAGPSSELAASFNEMAERIERLIRSRDELVQAVSHELGSPLSRLRFHLELLEKPSGVQGQQRLNAMSRDLDALDELVAELLGYVQSDDLELDQQEFDPSRGLSDLVELATLEAPEDKVVDVELELPTGVIVVADKRLFQRAVENLLRNAVQHAHSKVQLELTQGDGEVRVAVHDDGPGIPEELREKVLTPFFRLQSDRGRKTGGVGLGLAIVSRIMHRHGGRIDIASSPLGGATVATSWPRPR
ncbi:MAG: ATP-binding protein [Myxococcota bacterium]